MNMLPIVILALVSGKLTEVRRTHTEEEYWSAWQGFLKIPEVHDHHEMYRNKQEHDVRFEIFKDNLEEIKSHNSKNLTWKKGVNQFSDMTSEEFRKYSTCVTFEDMKNLDSLASKARSSLNATVPDSIDWVAEGAVTPIKNQGSCGSCWAFSTTGVMEGRAEIATGTLRSLSEQELVDCSKDGCYGCSGGWPYKALNYIYHNGGICTEADYSYKGVDGTCYDSSCTKYSSIKTYAYVERTTADMEAAVAAGPVSIVIDASFGSYSSGVLTSYCGTSFNHAVLLVGYGTDPTYGDYWKVKNSWGTLWGEDGYIRLCRNCNRNNGQGQCGILTYGVYPLM